MDALNKVYEKNIIIMANKLVAQLEKTNSLREVILYLISFKHFVDTNQDVIEQ